MENNFCQIATFNLRGFNQGSSYLVELLKCNDILCVQEHWLASNDFCKLINLDTNFTVLCSSSMEEVLSRGPLRGRPFGGIAVFIRNTIIKKLKIISMRDRYIILQINNMLLLNVYLPCNDDDLFADVLGDISDIIANKDHSALYTVLVGDFNSSPDASNTLGNLLKCFLLDNNLCSIVKSLANVADELYSFSNNDGTAKSLIDFIFVSKNLVDNILFAKIIDSGINLSDHRPVICKFFYSDLAIPAVNGGVAKAKFDKEASSPVLRWDKGDLSMYYELSRLNLLQVLNIGFTNVNPVDLSKSVDGEFLIENFYNQIIDALLSSDRVIPRASPSLFKFWWNEHLDHLKERALSKFRIWESVGKPRGGAVWLDMTQTKLEYKKTIKFYEKAQRDNFTDGLVDNLVQKDMQGFWKSWNSKFGKNRNCCKIIENCTTDSDIACEFKSYFSRACAPNNVNIHSQHEQDFYREYGGYAAGGPEDFHISICDVDAAMKKLKLGKAMGADRVAAEHLLYAHPSLSMCLTSLFNLMLYVGYVPDAFGMGIMIALHKDSKLDPTKCDNYRCLTISSVFSKLFEYVLLDKFEDFLATSDLQFGFKRDVGCSDAIYTVRSVVDYFVRSGNTVTITALDISKAFDKISHFALYNKLMTRGAPKCFIDLLISWYSKCYASVKWNGVFSDKFSVCAGVRQGGVLSPKLFAIYIEDLITALKGSRLGCCINGNFLGCFLYADDLLLVSQSFSCMQKMLDICNDIVCELNLKFNVTKSMFMRIGLRFRMPTANLYLDGQALCKVAEIRYLGVYIKAGKLFRCSYSNCKLKFYRCFNAIYHRSISAASEIVSVQLMKFYCIPLVLFALEVTNCSKSELLQLDKLIYTAVGKIFKTFDSDIIGVIRACCELDNVDAIVNRRLVKFCKSFALKNFSFMSVIININFSVGERLDRLFALC